MADLLAQLNPPQKEAVSTTNGPVLVLAGAGSGKTRVLTYRMYYMLRKGIARPENILAVTFTNKAAGEMKNRIADLLQSTGTPMYSLPWVGTFHSICVRLLKANAEYIGLSKEFSIYDRSDQLDAVKDVMKRLQMDTKQIKPNAVLNYISSAKSELIPPSRYGEYAVGYFQDRVAEIYPEYQKLLRSNTALDFDDLIMETVRLFEQEGEILDRYQRLFTHIMVDEYQDTNHAQYKLIKLLAEKHKNICVVGDDAQSIYSFRGATIQNILNFEKDYPDAKVIKLEQNYRSTKTILDASNLVISLNPNQKKKELWTDNDHGDPITIYEALDEKDEADWVAKQIKDMDTFDTAVLYRTNAQSRALEEALLRRGISYQVVGSVEFYKRKEIKDVMAYLRVLYNQADDISLKRIINVPRRGIGGTTLGNVEREALANRQSILPYLLGLQPEELARWGKSVNEFTQMMKKLINISKQEVIGQLITDLVELTGYRQSLDDGTSENEQRLENIRELITVAERFKELDPVESMERFLEEISLIEGYNNRDDGPSIKLMTVHSAKGLEFDNLFIVGMEEGIFPHSNSYVDPTQMEEERRLAYVAITRAKQNLYIVHTQSRTFFGSRSSNPVSRFVSDIPDELLRFETVGGPVFDDGWREVVEDEDYQQDFVELNKGDKVEHDIFGVGIVVDYDDSLIIVGFKGGQKELSREYAKLKKI